MGASEKPEGNGLMLLAGAVFLLLAALLILAVVPMVPCPSMLCGMARSTPSLDPNPRVYEPGATRCSFCRGQGRVTLLRWWRSRGVPILGSIP